MIAARKSEPGVRGLFNNSRDVRDKTACVQHKSQYLRCKQKMMSDSERSMTYIELDIPPLIHCMIQQVTMFGPTTSPVDSL